MHPTKDGEAEEVLIRVAIERGLISASVCQRMLQHPKLALNLQNTLQRLQEKELALRHVAGASTKDVSGFRRGCECSDGWNMVIGNLSILVPYRAKRTD